MPADILRVATEDASTNNMSTRTVHFFLFTRLGQLKRNLKSANENAFHQIPSKDVTRQSFYKSFSSQLPNS